MLSDLVSDRPFSIKLRELDKWKHLQSSNNKGLSLKCRTIDISYDDSVKNNFSLSFFFPEIK